MTDGKPEILKWRKHKVYRCRVCGWDTLDRKAFEDHYAKVHPPFRVIDGGKKNEPEPTVEPDTDSNKEGN